MEEDFRIKPAKVDKSAIINYEVQMMEQNYPQTKPIVSHSNKYSFWDLNRKIKEVMSDENVKVRWIGNSKNAYLETYAYIMLIASGFSEESMMQFKHTIYKLGRSCLDKKEQKLLVQFMNLIDYSNDRYSFLNKYPQIESIFVKILQYVEEDHSPSSNGSGPNSKKKARVKKIRNTINKIFQNESAFSSSQQYMEVELQLQQIYQVFSRHFRFIQIVGSNQYCCTLNLFGYKRVYIIIEKDCYFMVQATTVSKSSHFSQVNKQLANDFQILISGDSQVQAEKKHKKPAVQQSNVIPVQRASQIRKPNENEMFNTPKFVSLAKESPKKITNGFDLAIPKNKYKEADRSFIEDLMANNTGNNTGQSHESKLIDYNDTSTKKNSHKNTLLQQKMSQIKIMKIALKKVMEKIDLKLKVIDQAQQLKSEVSKQVDQKFPVMSNKSLNISPQQVSNRNSYNVCQFIKKNRKVSYNEPRPSHKKQMYKGRPIGSSPKKYASPNPIMEGVLSQQARSLPRSKATSAEANVEAQLSPLYFSPTINSKINNHIPVMNSGNTSNVNVNVNVSINETPIINSRSQNAFKFYQPQHFKQIALVKPIKSFPSSHTISPTNLSVPQSTKNINNPEKNKVLKKI